jgi:hypothetical protein
MRLVETLRRKIGRIKAEPIRFSSDTDMIVEPDPFIPKSHKTVMMDVQAAIDLRQ